MIFTKQYKYDANCNFFCFMSGKQNLTFVILYIINITIIGIKTFFLVVNKWFVGNFSTKYELFKHVFQGE